MTEAHRIYRELKQDIVTCKLAPGLSVSEQDIRTCYHASRTPVREACRPLCNGSLMQMIPFRGYSVPSLTIEEYRNLYELQTVVEPAVAALAAERATQEQLKEIEFSAPYEYHAGQKSSYYTFLEWNLKFHICIAVASRNQALLDIVTNLQTRLMRYYYLVIVMDSYGADLVAEHREMVKALRSGKPEIARERASDHLVNTVRRTMKTDLRSVNLPSEMLSAVVYSDWLTSTATIGAERPRAARSKGSQGLLHIARQPRVKGDRIPSCA